MGKKSSLIEKKKNKKTKITKKRTSSNNTRLMKISDNMDMSASQEREMVEEMGKNSLMENKKKKNKKSKKIPQERGTEEKMGKNLLMENKKNKKSTVSNDTWLEESFDMDTSASQGRGMEEEMEKNSLMENERSKRSTFSNYSWLEERFAVSQERKMKEQMEGHSIRKEYFKWSHAAIMVLLEEYRLQASSFFLSFDKISYKRAWDEITAIMSTKGYKISGRQCPLTAVLPTGFVTSRFERPEGSNCCSNICTSQSSDAVSRKRKATDVIERLMQFRRITEEGKDRRHEERIKVQTKILEKLDKIMKQCRYTDQPRC